MAGQRKSDGSGFMNICTDQGQMKEHLGRIMKEAWSFRPDPSDPAWEEPEVHWAAMTLPQWRSLCDQWAQIAICEVGSGDFDQESATKIAWIGDALAWKAAALSFRSDALRRFSRESRGISMGLGDTGLNQLRSAIEDAVEVVTAVRDWVTGQELAQLTSLPDGHLDCLQALREEKAFDLGSRIASDRIAMKALGASGDGAAIRDVLGEMVRNGLVASRVGRGGGYWLTTKGQALVNAERPAKL